MCRNQSLLKNFYGVLRSRKVGKGRGGESEISVKKFYRTFQSTVTEEDKFQQCRQQKLLDQIFKRETA